MSETPSIAMVIKHDFPRLFSVAEAQRTLPLVRVIVRDLLALGRQAQAIAPEHATESTFDDLHEQLSEHLAELIGIGCYFKDWNLYFEDWSFAIGLVDFPALIDDEVVFLCWRSDEPELRYYHRIGDGYAGRRPLPPT